MGKIQLFQLTLQNNILVYYPGQWVIGKCIVLLNGEEQVKHIKIYMRGLAKVHWTETETRQVSVYTSRGPQFQIRQETVSYSAERKFFSMIQVMFGNPSGDVKTVLPAGHHEFPFSFQLPSIGLPTSFEGTYGNIRYWLEGEIKKSWIFNPKTKQAFTVISPIDINREEYLIPVQNRGEKTICCLCCTGGEISLVVWTDRNGYCPGESIIIRAEVENHSSRIITPYVTLHQNQTCFAGGNTKIATNKIQTQQGTCIQPGGYWDPIIFNIPAIPPSILDCDIMNVKYYLQVILDIPNALNLSLTLPITIGTEPLRRPQFSEMTTPGVFPSAPSKTDTYPNDAPPTYAECMQSPVDIRDHENDKDIMGSTLFRPMYTYVQNYQIPPTYSQATSSVPDQGRY